MKRKIISILTVLAMLGTYPLSFAENYTKENEPSAAVADQTGTEPLEMCEIVDVANEEIEIEEIDENSEPDQPKEAA